MPLTVRGGWDRTAVRVATVVGGTEMSAGPRTLIHMTTRIDCDACAMRGLGCHDCVVAVLLGAPPALSMEDDETAALGALAAEGLLPPLRMVDVRPMPMIDSA